MVVYPDYEEPRRIVKAECTEKGVFVYLNSDSLTHELYNSSTLMSLTKDKRWFDEGKQ
jgi:hypothetical protein